MGMEFERRLPIPMEVKAQYPLTPQLEALVTARAAETAAILTGADDRLLLIIGPCSADNEDSVLEYISRLRRVQDRVAEKLHIIPRLYTNKPRTTGAGYKGMLHQPDPGEKPDLYRGIVSTRQLHLRTLTETGFTCADELLYPENHRFLSDLLGYVAVGARSVENQQHRLVASGLEIPVGMKNPTGGDTAVMLNAITAAQHGHSFIYRNWAVHSTGNPLAHAVLRGYVDRSGQSCPNYHYDDLAKLAQDYAAAALANPAVIVDVNHANSGKRYLEQPRIVEEVLESTRRSPAIRKLVKGFMVESYLEDGAQAPGGSVYGQSITDPCLGWEKTEQLILELAERV